MIISKFKLLPSNLSAQRLQNVLQTDTATNVKVKKELPQISLLFREPRSLSHRSTILLSNLTVKQISPQIKLPNLELNSPRKQTDSSINYNQISNYKNEQISDSRKLANFQEQKNPQISVNQKSPRYNIFRLQNNKQSSVLKMDEQQNIELEYYSNNSFKKNSPKNDEYPAKKTQNNKFSVVVKTDVQKHVELEYYAKKSYRQRNYRTDQDYSSKKSQTHSLNKNDQKHIENEIPIKLKNSVLLKRDDLKQVEKEYYPKTQTINHKFEEQGEKNKEIQNFDTQQETRLSQVMHQKRNIQRKNTMTKKKQIKNQLITKDLIHQELTDQIKIIVTEHIQQNQSLVDSDTKEVQEVINMIKIKISSESVSADDSNVSEEFLVWDDSELAMRGINVNTEYFTIQQQMAKLYQIRSGTYPDLREDVSKEEIANNLKKLLCQTNDKLSQRIDQAVQMVDNYANYSKIQGCTQNNMNFYAFKDFAKKTRDSKTNESEVHKPPSKLKLFK